MKRKTKRVAGFTLALLVFLGCTAPSVAAAPKEQVTYSVTTYEDGSGLVYRTEQHRWKRSVTRHVATLDEGVLPWDCTANGNQVCGEGAPESVRGYGCSTFVVEARPERRMKEDIAITSCTDGTVTWRKATDEDVEGEVV